MALRIEDKGWYRVISDDLNPCLSHTEFRCHACEAWVDAEETLWVRSNGVACALEGDPYHEACAPGPPREGPHGCDH